ncbi:hypothetical protein ACEQ8H_002016 [Pleosporales sp. CAS-2024a]
MKLRNLFGAALLAGQTIAHPGESAEQHAKDAAQRRAYLDANKGSLAHCADALKARGNDVAMHNRRASQIAQARAKRSIATEKPYLRVRDLDDALGTDHKSNLTGITPDTDPSLLFSGNNSCVLSPEVTEGPYWVKGELIREDITDGQEGVPLFLDLQIIDVNTCEPVPEVFLDIWHCNSTGVYSGVVAQGNGDQNDATNLDQTFNRGIQKSDKDGVVAFETTFPGHYTGRAVHIHVLTTLNATVNANNTLVGGSIAHVGQIFFDQSLIGLVEQEAPYTSNTQTLTENARDFILASEAATTDPFVEYVLLGDNVSDGLFGWLAFGVDLTASYDATPAVFWTENGGVENENSRPGPGGRPPFPSGSPTADSTSDAASLAGKQTSSVSGNPHSGICPN